MSPSSDISQALRDRVRARDDYRCRYCLAPEALLYGVLRIDHIIPRAAGGANDEDNLCANCDPCNAHKADKTAGADPETGQIVPLFNPITQTWATHFTFAEDKATIVGLTSIGRATVVALKMNNADVLELRRRWVSVGWYPPR